MCENTKIFKTKNMTCVIFTHCLKKKKLKANTKSFFLLLKLKFDSTHNCCSFNNCI